MSTVSGKVMVEVEYKFDIDEIKEVFGEHLTPVQVEHIAQELAANVTLSNYDGGLIRLNEWYFGDSFVEMLDTLREAHKE